VQNVLGTSDEVRRLQREQPEDGNQLSVRLELQADCYAGVWANTVFEQGELHEGDIDELIRDAFAAGMQWAFRLVAALALLGVLVSVLYVGGSLLRPGGAPREEPGAGASA
jgi:predicted metalloprotease